MKYEREKSKVGEEPVKGETRDGLTWKWAKSGKGSHRSITTLAGISLFTLLLFWSFLVFIFHLSDSVFFLNIFYGNV